MKLRSVLLGGVTLSACWFPTSVFAQAMTSEEARILREQVAALKAQVERLESRLNAVPDDPSSPRPLPVIAASSPTQAVQFPAKEETVIDWKGGPLLKHGDASFHLKGRIQYDAALLMTPKGVEDSAKGYSNEFRRLRLGGEGAIGRGFGYKLEVELSDNAVDLVDTFITYERGNWLVTLGNHNAFQSLDELISDTGGAVMERAAFTDAFGFERRLGLSAQYRAGMLIAQAGIFSDSVDSLTNDENGDDNNSFGIDGRLVLAPTLGTTQLHFAASGHWRDLQALSDTPQRYRQRPYVHSVNTRFLATPAISATGESHYGLEFAGERGAFWWVGEAHWMRVARPVLSDPTFFGAYGEVGYVLTGERRGYKNGIFGVVKPDRPVGSGGWGALQATLRYDYLNLNDKGIVGGTQNGMIAALVWTPVEFVRFNVNYAHMAYTDAAILAGGRRDYGVDVVGWRAELDF